MNYTCGCTVQEGVAACPKHGQAPNVLSEGSSILTDQVKYGEGPKVPQTPRDKTVQVILAQAYDQKPLVIMHDSPCGNGTEHRPEQLRSIASMLVKIAGDAEAHHADNLTKKLNERKWKLTTYSFDS